MQREALEEARAAEVLHLKLQLNSAWAEAEALRSDAAAAAEAARAAQERVRAAAQAAAEKDAELETQRQWARDALRLRGLAFDKVRPLQRAYLFQRTCLEIARVRSRF